MPDAAAEAGAAGWSFASDNGAGIDPRVLDAIARCDAGPAPAYGADALSARLDAAYSEVFEHKTFVFPVPTGTVANALALAAAGIALRPWPHPDGDLFCIVTSFRNASELLLRFETALPMPRGKGS